jgi:hypothetical protein
LCGRSGVGPDRNHVYPSISDKQLANEIKKLPDYDPKKAIRLNICEAGKGKDSHAKALSKLLPNPVIGSTTDVHALSQKENGKIVETPDKMTPVDEGKWRTFQNGKEIEQQKK